MADIANALPGGKLWDAQTQAATANTDIVDIRRATAVNVHIKTSNTDIVGTWEVEVSNDDTLNDWIAAEFTDGTSSIAEASGTDVDEMRSLVYTGAKWLRVKFTNTSGSTGTAEVYVAATRNRS